MDFRERIRRKNEFDASLVYGTQKFSVLTKLDKHFECVKQRENQWTNPKTGIIHDRYAEYRNCPLCEANEFETLFIKYGFPHVKCNRCGLVYVNPILNKNEYAKLTRVKDSWEDVLETEDKVKTQALEANYILDIVESYLNKKDARICDIGCGPGTLLGEAKKRGYRILGVEPNKRYHRLLGKKGVDYIGDSFPLRQNISEKFDHMFLINTLEHLREPLEIVREAKKLLEPSGIIYVSAPNIESLVTRILHEKSGTFGGEEHIQFFSRKTLSSLLEKAGFEILEYDTVLTESGAIRNYLGFKDPYFGGDADGVSLFSPEFIYKGFLGSKLHLVGRSR